MTGTRASFFHHIAIFFKPKTVIPLAIPSQLLVLNGDDRFTISESTILPVPQSIKLLM
jgi:hypothetical protein